MGYRSNLDTIETSRLEPPRLLQITYEGVLWPFDKKIFFELVTHVNTQDFTVYINFSKWKCKSI